MQAHHQCNKTYKKIYVGLESGSTIHIDLTGYTKEARDKVLSAIHSGTKIIDVIIKEK